MPADAREVFEWLCDEESDAGLGPALLRLRRGEWRDDELDRLQRIVGREAWLALYNLEGACEWSEERGEHVASLEALRTPRLDDVQRSLRFLASLGRHGEWVVVKIDWNRIYFVLLRAVYIHLSNKRICY